MSKILIKNIKELIQVGHPENGVRKGSEMQEVPSIKNAFLAVEDDRIVAYGKMEDWGGITDWRDLEVIDAEDRLVLPTFVDSHTHLVFAAPREEEFEDRIKGLTYEEIAAKGGGILNSARKLRGMSEEDLYEGAMKRLDEVIQTGTGAIEIKSGYGLTVESELKILRVIKRIKENAPVPVKATFLGAHAYPEDYKDNHEGYVDLIINEMIPKIKAEGLADYIDVFCEQGYFETDATDKILKAGIAAGMKPKIHVNQFHISGGVQVGVANNALSVDHLEAIGDEEVEALKGSTTIPSLLPSCSFFIKIPYAPARKLIDAGLPVSLASDYNPGSTPTGNIPFIMSLACIQMNMTPQEALNATTINAAKTIELEEELGTIEIGKRANILISKKMNNLAYIPYAFGSQHIEQIILNGKRYKSES